MRLAPAILAACLTVAACAAPLKIELAEPATLPYPSLEVAAEHVVAVAPGNCQSFEVLIAQLKDGEREFLLFLAPAPARKFVLVALKNEQPVYLWQGRVGEGGVLIVKNHGPYHVEVHGTSPCPMLDNEV